MATSPQEAIARWRQAAESVSKIEWLDEKGCQIASWTATPRPGSGSARQRSIALGRRPHPDAVEVLLTKRTAKGAVLTIRVETAHIAELML